MAFSSGLVLSDLSDYLAPSQICIKPVEQEVVDEEDAKGQQEEDGVAATEIKMEVDEGPSTAAVAVKKEGQGKKLQKAQITLNDCLACSGCITSAESVLVSLQSHTELLSTLSSDPSLVPVLSLAPQSLASLAAFHRLPTRSVLRSLRRFFKRRLGFRLVTDTTFAREVALLESRLEFAERSRLRSLAPDADVKGKAKAAESPMPILASACPGWICYAEKTHGALLPFISRTKSPQQVQGSLVKSPAFCRMLGVDRPERILHVAAMMCYDKKLEASRPDFRVSGAEEGKDGPGWREVDCVLTTGEVQKLLDEMGWDLRAGSEVEPEEEEEPWLPELVPGRGSSSGGYLANIISGVIESIPTSDWPRLRLTVEPRRGNDYVDHTLFLSSLPIFKGATCYGFRNLQNVVRKVGRDKGLSLVRGAASASSSGASTPTMGRPMGGKSGAALAAAARRAARKGLATPLTDGGQTAVAERGYDYVEVMACPSGCVNGGGQIPPPSPSHDAEGMPIVDGDGTEVKMVASGNGDGGSVRSAKDWVDLVEKVYWTSVSATSGGGGKAGFPMPDGVDELDRSILPYVLPVPQEAADAQEKARRWLDELERQGGREERDRYVRTGYRAVESEEVNGLAVKW